LGKNSTTMKVLGIETATRAGGAALLEDGVLVAEEYNRDDITHTKRLLPAIDKLLESAGWSPDNIDLVAVSLGPGSFTGLRIGLSVGKGIAVATKAEIIGVSTLEAFAFILAKKYKDLPIRPVIDARKEEVYTAPFDHAGRREGPDENIKPEALADKLEGKMVLAGDGALKYEEIFMKSRDMYSIRVPRFHAVRPSPELDAPRPAAVAQLGLIMHQNGARQAVETLAPIYVRGPDAVVNPGQPKKAPRI